MKKSIYSITCLFLFAWVPLNCLHAQTFDRYVVGSSGTYATSGSGSMSWTIGEVMIETYSSTNKFFTQGFHQPDAIAVPIVMRDFFIPEGFSPNGDGTNDLFVIRGIQYYPDNSFVIYNRWGNKVFEASPYTNTWDGRSAFGIRVGGDELPIGTYFYILDLKNYSAIYKGTIYLNR